VALDIAGFIKALAERRSKVAHQMIRR